MSDGAVQTFTIKGELPDLNKYTAAINRYRLKGAAMKRRAEKKIKACIKESGIKPVTDYPVVISYLWVCKNRRKDKDNIAFAQKFVQDALVTTGILENDGWKQVSGFDHRFDVNSRKPCVIVTIEKEVPDERMD